MNRASIPQSYHEQRFRPHSEGRHASHIIVTNSTPQQLDNITTTTTNMDSSRMRRFSEPNRAWERDQHGERITSVPKATPHDEPHAPLFLNNYTTSTKNTDSTRKPHRRRKGVRSMLRRLTGKQHTKDAEPGVEAPPSSCPSEEQYIAHQSTRDLLRFSQMNCSTPFPANKVDENINNKDEQVADGTSSSPSGHQITHGNQKMGPVASPRESPRQIPDEVDKDMYMQLLAGTTTTTTTTTTTHNNQQPSLASPVAAAASPRPGAWAMDGNQSVASKQQQQQWTTATERQTSQNDLLSSSASSSQCMEIAPGVTVTLTTRVDPHVAFRSMDCLACSTFLYYPENATLVLCPTCRVMQHSCTRREEEETDPRLFLGCTVEDVVAAHSKLHRASRLAHRNG